MAHQGAPAPKRVEERLLALAGDEDERRVLYCARRFLGYEVEEWRALPWWKQAVYKEGLAEEFRAPDEDEGVTA